MKIVEPWEDTSKNPMLQKIRFQDEFRPYLNGTWFLANILCSYSRCPWMGHPSIFGWWFQPLWKILVSWDDDIPNILKNKKCSKPPTRSENRPCLAPLGLQTFAGPFLPALEAALQFPQRRLTAERGARRSDVWGCHGYENHGKNGGFNQQWQG